MSRSFQPELSRAAEALRRADALLIGAGAGMGVDSGLPDFRGTQGFWRAYPPYAKLGLDFASMANPSWFHSDPPFAWGFYGHRMNLYRAAVPHEGFAILRRWGDSKNGGGFVVTSNIDGQFQRAGFDPDRVAEIHGSIHWLQCLRSCGARIFPADSCSVTVDEETFRASEPLPDCPGCGGLARPNVLMFGDMDWLGARSDTQHDRLIAWLGSIDVSRLVVVECGAGLGVPSIRRFCEQTVRASGGLLIRINVREPQVPSGHIGLPMGALDALRELDAMLSAD